MGAAVAVTRSELTPAQLRAAACASEEPAQIRRLNVWEFLRGNKLSALVWTTTTPSSMPVSARGTFSSATQSASAPSAPEAGHVSVARRAAIRSSGVNALD